MPMVDHAVASRTNIERLRQVYHQLYKYRDPSKIFAIIHLLNFELFLIFRINFLNDLEISIKEAEMASGNRFFNFL